MDRALDVVLVDDAFCDEGCAEQPDGFFLAAGCRQLTTERARDEVPCEVCAQSRQASPAADAARSRLNAIDVALGEERLHPDDSVRRCGRFDRRKHQVGVDRLPVGIRARVDTDDLDRAAERAIDARPKQLMQFVVPRADNCRGEQLLAAAAALEPSAHVHGDVGDFIIE